jgi:protein gp37
MVSFEPLLEDLGEVNLQGIGWAIVGGESGRGARPFEISWANNLRIQCKEAGVPFFLKQWGSNAQSAGEAIAYRDSKGGDPNEWPEHLRVREFPKPYAGHQVVRLQRRVAA